MNTRRLARLLPVLLAAAAPAAFGASAGQSTVGATCGLVAYGSPDAHVRSGAVTSGPWQATTPGAVVTSVTCSIQVGSDDPVEDDVARVSTQAPYLPPTPVTYAVQDKNVDVFVCTEVTVVRPPDPPVVEHYDADPTRPGPQCRKAKREQNDVVVVDVAPSDPTTWWCVRVEHGLPPWGYQEVCNPIA